MDNRWHGNLARIICLEALSLKLFVTALLIAALGIPSAATAL